ncbi:RNA ligase family protein [Burkholderia cenocepacia]|uniref:RNA ligase family protein n=1 Tax=Burkholderia cenocepacia TaxID=95486 RepID=UPI0009B425AF|nr:RNA ligase family protein [Burkholderia cenocepacia]
MDDSKLIEVLGLEIDKYPRTPHLEGSKFQKGDEGYDHTPYAVLQGHHIVVEEKIDAANSGISFSPAGDLLLQSRGHYLTGGGRERQFNLFKQWATAHEAWLLERLEDRYVMYGEWCHKKHVMFLDQIPHYFQEFDVLCKRTKTFLSTSARRELLAGGPVLSVPVLYEGTAPRKIADFKALLLPSLARSKGWRDTFEKVVLREKLNLEKAWEQTDKSDLSEGLYVKVELDDKTVGRYKFVRHGFVQAILDSSSHHADQPFIPNLLADGVDIFAPKLTHTWDTIPDPFEVRKRLAEVHERIARGQDIRG